MGAPNNNSASTTEVQFRRHTAVELRRTGMSYVAIGEHLGVNRKTAWRYVQDALIERARETATDRDALVGEQIVVIETVLEGLLPKVAAGDARAAEVVLKALDRHARLFGLDAPVQIKAELTNERVSRVMQLAEQLAEAAGSGQ
ncbi:hypothetical protein GCM10009759_55270 [Kitasatospora saccharophila]|uniref:Homeodomain-like domain-containing protein n=1 Tax=Kitasatospora saccharophila TaxID=407973 RepID=A0ABP5J7L6_9ACTN